MENNIIQDKNNINLYIDKTPIFKFRKYPSFIKLFKFSEKADSLEINNINSQIKVSNIIYKIKFGSFKLGNTLGSFSFGIFLFAMQSYFLRQNLGLTDKSFISD